MTEPAFPILTAELEYLTRFQAKLVDQLSKLLGALPPGSERWIDRERVAAALQRANAIEPAPRLEDLPIASETEGKGERAPFIRFPLPLPEDVEAWKRLRGLVEFTCAEVERTSEKRQKLREELRAAAALNVHKSS